MTLNTSDGRSEYGETTSSEEVTFNEAERSPHGACETSHPAFQASALGSQSPTPTMSALLSQTPVVAVSPTAGVQAFVFGDPTVSGRSHFVERYIDQKASDRGGFYDTNHTQLKFLRVTQCDSALTVPQVLFPGGPQPRRPAWILQNHPTSRPDPATAASQAPSRYSPWAGRSECRVGRLRSRKSRRRRPGPALLHFNRQRRRSARSGRPGEAPRASRTRPAPGGERAPGGPAGRGGRVVRALAHLAHRTHGCAGPARAWLPGRRSDPGSHPARPLQAGHYIPHPGRAPEGRPYPGGAGGGGARRCGPGRLDKSTRPEADPDPAR
ncbi:unnamed protein product [Rangifer tarandus platyrhynchus]|uniref:Uncharacterized protein n=1 Tax=Rangifer tarandus platyrhynchus TaxID=3082113 RepID=A0ABN8YDH9_RANTA|nr:unnamed protein product [Rangifer tarandus platyrhynchus]